MNFRVQGFNSKSLGVFDDITNKEKDMRIKWNYKYQSANDKSTSDEYDNWKAKIRAAELDEFLNRMKFRPPPDVPDHRYRKPDNSKDINEYLTKLGIKDTKDSSKVKPIFMYDVDKKEKESIYNGISRDLEGRFKYLNERKKKKPQEKFAFPLTNSMEYGWKYYDNNGKFASKEDLESEFYQASTMSFPSPYSITNSSLNDFSRNNGVLSDQCK